MGAIGLPDCVGGAVHIVGTAPAVNMYVYESGGDIAVAGIDDHVRGTSRASFRDVDDFSAGELDGAAREYPVRENDLSGERYTCRSHEKRIS
jgi:hypothetical protein